MYVGLGATTHIVDPGHQPSASLMVVGAGVIFVMRVWLARLADAERARALFAGLVTFGTAVPCSLIVALRAAGVVAVIGLPPSLGPSSATSGCTTAGCSSSFTFLIVAACLPAMGLRFEQRIVYVVAVTVTAAFDAVGGETHQVMLCGATLFGLMLGHQWDDAAPAARATPPAGTPRARGRLARGGGRVARGEPQGGAREG